MVNNATSAPRRHASTTAASSSIHYLRKTSLGQWFLGDGSASQTSDEESAFLPKAVLPRPVPGSSDIIDYKRRKELERPRSPSGSRGQVRTRRRRSGRGSVSVHKNAKHSFAVRLFLVFLTAWIVFFTNWGKELTRRTELLAQSERGEFSERLGDLVSHLVQPAWSTVWGRNRGQGLDSLPVDDEGSLYIPSPTGLSSEALMDGNEEGGLVPDDDESVYRAGRIIPLEPEP